MWLSPSTYNSKNVSRKIYSNCTWNATITSLWKDSSQRKNFLPKMDNIKWYKIMCQLQDTQTSHILSCTITETICTSKIRKSIWNWQNTTHSWQKKYIYWVTLTNFSSSALHWMKQLFIIEKITIKNVLFILRNFRYYPGVKLSFEHNSNRKNFFLSACRCWDDRLSLGEIDQKVKFGGIIGYGDSFLEFLFRCFKVIRLHAILNDAAGAVRSFTRKGRDYRYMVGRGPNSFFLGHVTGLLFCLYVKLFPPSIFNSVNFWSSMSCVELDNELADITLLMSWDFLLVAMFRDTHFVLQKYKPIKQAFSCIRKLQAQWMCGLEWA